LNPPVQIPASNLCKTQKQSWKIFRTLSRNTDPEGAEGCCSSHRVISTKKKERNSNQNDRRQRSLQSFELQPTRTKPHVQKKKRRFCWKEQQQLQLQAD
jgi:hypothetical protein